MAEYLVVPDDYAGWNPTGRNFALVCAAAGSIGLLSWSSLNGYLGTYRPSAAADQVFLSGLVWLGAGGFVLMAIAALGSIMLSLRSRGTVSVTGEGVTRTIGKRTQMLAWPDIQGLVPMPYGGVTLISSQTSSNIVIPRFLDDYRACIAEIKDHGIQRLPPSSLSQTGTLRKKRKTTWQSGVRNFAQVFFYLLAIGAHVSHLGRIASFVTAIAFMAWTLHDDWSRREQFASTWVGLVMILCLILYAMRRMALSW